MFDLKQFLSGAPLFLDKITNLVDPPNNAGSFKRLRRLVKRRNPENIPPKNPLAKIARVLWGGFFLLIAFVISFLLSVQFNWFNLYGDMPDLQSFDNLQPAAASEIYSSKGVAMGRYFTENRSPVRYEEINPLVIKALLSTEDARFFEHSGIDLRAIAGSLKDLLVSDKRRGASTITQQLAKNLFKTREEENQGRLSNTPLLGTLSAKAKEWIMAVQLEKRYTKREILTLYLNTVDFGSNSFGIKTAAKRFFNTTPNQLSLQEAALLIGGLKATTAYHPLFYPKRSQTRRNTVIDNMVAQGYVSKKIAENAKFEPLGIDWTVSKEFSGRTGYYNQAIKRYLEKWCLENGYDLYQDGLKVYTSLDLSMQEHAEKAMKERMKILQKRFERQWRGEEPWRDSRNRPLENFLMEEAKQLPLYKKLKAQYPKQPQKILEALHTFKKMSVFTWNGVRDTLLSTLDSIAHYKKFLHCGLMTMDPKTGFIKAWVGGIDYRYFQFDMVSQARRQPGSTFKAFVYATAIDKGYSPCYRMKDSRPYITYRERINDSAVVTKRWMPANADWVHTDKMVTLRCAIGRSMNTITAKLAMELGIEEIIAMARKLGITTPIDTFPSMCLGASPVSLFEMVGAYATFLNKGIWTEPTFVTRIEDRYGNTIYSASPRRRKAMDEEDAWLMTYMLRGGIEEPQGTSQGLWQFPKLYRGNQLAGKTGTSQNYADGWYFGLTKDLVTGVWVGGDDPAIHFRDRMGEGSKTALPIFGTYMSRLFEDTTLNMSRGYFPPPPKGMKRTYYCPTPKDMFDEPEVDSLYADSMALRDILFDSTLVVPQDMIVE